MQKKIYYRVEVPSPIETIRKRSKELFDEKADKEGLSETAFAKAMGDLSPSWANHFLKGRRNVTDITLIAKIARFFGTSVGYLIGETVSRDDSTLTAILVECKDLSTDSRKIVLGLAQSLPKTPTPPESGAGGSAAPPSKPRKRPR